MSSEVIYQWLFLAYFGQPWALIIWLIYGGVVVFE
jgi:hypothetical protein